MDKRIVRMEDESWHIRTETGELSPSERKELTEYFDEINLPYRFVNGCLCIAGKVGWDAVFERLEHFYDGRADVLPF